MFRQRHYQWLIGCLAVPLILIAASVAEEPRSKTQRVADWPQKVVVNVGELRTRVDGPKLWTLSGIDYQDSMMATEDSAYGTVLTIRNVGLLGTAHFLDVPGKPGEVEKEKVTHLQLFVDDMAVKEFAPTMNLTGSSFRMERRSQIRAVDLESTIALRNGVLTETVHFRATGPVDLRVSYPWMYAWTPQATHFVFGNDRGIQRRGEFRQEGNATSEVVKNATWMALFNPTSRKGAVCCFLKHPPDVEGSFLLVDAPGIYRKVAAYTLVDSVVPKGFAGTYQSAVGFFTAKESNWEGHAQRRAVELRTFEKKKSD